MIEESALIIEASALVSMCLREPGFEILAAKVDSRGRLLMSAPTLLETFIVVDARRRQDASNTLSRFVGLLEVVPFDQELAEIARVAYRLYGKGTGHPAQLNFGDCFSYALSKRTGYPLLCSGNDFRQTDIRIA
jgi:ribonuclease VapC